MARWLSGTRTPKWPGGSLTFQFNETTVATFATVVGTGGSF